MTFYYDCSINLTEKYEIKKIASKNNENEG
jgi:hypothetical protein